MPLTVSAGSETSFTISFSPAGEGMRSAMVKIVSNDQQTPEFTFSIQGTGKDVVTEIASQQKGSHLSIYPVPGDGRLFITGTSSCNCNWLTVKAYTAQGNLAGGATAARLSPSDDRMFVDLSDMPRGYYILMLYYPDQGYTTFPFVLTH